MFLFDRKPVAYCTFYKYLGCTLNEHLDFTFTVSSLADSSGRALSSIITKMIKNGGFPFKMFCTLYQACVCSISDYSGEVFGYESFESTKKVHLRAARSFLGVPKTTPISGIISECNLLLPQYRTQIRMIRQYHRVIKMNDTRLTKKIFLWDKKVNEENLLNTWHSEVKSIFSANDMSTIYESGNVFELKGVIEKMEKCMLLAQQADIKLKCENMPKLRTFIKFKDFSNTPSYLTKPLSFIQRKFLAKIRLGSLELRIETGRYSRPRLHEEARTCLVCNNQEIENEAHFLFNCQTYQAERLAWTQKLTVPDNFLNLPVIEKLDLVLNTHSNVKPTAQYIINIFDKRSKIVNNLPNTMHDNPVLYHLEPHDQCPACTLSVQDT